MIYWIMHIMAWFCCIRLCHDCLDQMVAHVAGPACGWTDYCIVGWIMPLLLAESRFIMICYRLCCNEQPELYCTILWLAVSCLLLSLQPWSWTVYYSVACLHFRQLTGVLKNYLMLCNPWNTLLYTVLRIRIRDPVPFWPLYPGSGMNNPDHISESLETNFWVKILKLFDADPGSRIWSGMEKIWIRDPGWKTFGSGIRDKHPGSATLVVQVHIWHLHNLRMPFVFPEAQFIVSGWGDKVDYSIGLSYRPARIHLLQSPFTC
jgi:hypothetical protein